MKKYIFNIVIYNTLWLSSASNAKEMFQDIHIISRELKNEMCKEMKKFSSVHVRKFFEKSQVILSESIHQYDVLDCHIRGYLRIGNKKFDFDIQPMGVGSLTDKKTGNTRLFGCKTCESFFPPVSN